MMDHYKTGLKLEKIGEHTKARYHFIQALDDKETNVDVLFKAAKSLEISNHDKEALRVYERIMEQGFFPNVLVNMGIIYEDAEQYSKALECFERVLEEDPTHNRAKKYFNDCLEAMDSSPIVDERDAKELQRLQREYKIPISKLGLSTRTSQCLSSIGVSDLYGLTLVDNMDLLLIKHFGRQQMEELQSALSSYRIRIGMNMTDKQNAKKRRLKDTAELIASNSKTGTNIDSLQIPIRIKNACRLIGIDTIAELASCTTQDLVRFKSFGKINEIRKILAKFDLTLKEDDI